MNVNDLNYKEVWDGEYKRIRFEIIHWRLGWNYYLLIPKEQLPTKEQNIFALKLKKYKFIDKDEYYFNYSGAPIISDLDWHGGITLYEKQRDERGKVIGYRLGCDYMHLWDEGKHYTVDSVMRDVKHSIDKLWELIPSLKLRCNWNGKYYDQEKVYFTEKNVCVALENKEKWEEIRK
jgi:hypothetical protein